jgi:hypothetical protein
VLLILHRPSQQLIVEFVRRRWVSITMLLVVFAAGSWLTFAPYFRTPGTGGYAWDETQKYLPPLAWYFPPWRTSDPMNGIGVADVSPEVHPLLPLNGFVFFGCGIVALVLIVWGRKRKSLENPTEDRAIPFAMAAMITAAVLVLVSARLPNDTTLWWIVYRFIPGGSGVRAVSRLDLMIDCYAILFLVIGIDRALKRIASDHRRAIVATCIAILLIAEQWVTGLSSFSAKPWEDQVTALAATMRSSGKPAYVVNNFPDDWPYSSSLQVTAMWAGMEANVPVVNGYSGRSPPGYPGVKRRWSAVDMKDWLARYPDVRGGVNVIDPDQKLGPPGRR